jgi:hypothetical protein
MNNALKIATGPVLQNALKQTYVIQMKSNVERKIFQPVYGPTAFEMTSVFQMTVNVNKNLFNFIAGSKNMFK